MGGSVDDQQRAAEEQPEVLVEVFRLDGGLAEHLEGLGRVVDQHEGTTKAHLDPEQRAEQVGALEPTVRQADADLRREGARILGRITGSHRCHLDAADPCAWLDPSTTPRSICAHLTFAGPTLMAAVTDPDWQVGLAALDGLVVASPRQEDLPTLAAWLRSPPPDDDDGSRFQARIADVLGRAGPEAATTTEALAWLATQRRPNDALQISALRALTAIGPPADAAVPTLVTLCESDRRSVRYGALEALGAIAPDDPRTREAAERARGDEDEQVRGLAEALSRGRE